MTNKLREEQMGRLQNYVTLAHDKWREGMMFYNTDYMTEKQLYAICVSKLNYQVENGGFSQWVDNGYCLSYAPLLNALEEIGTKTATAVSEMVLKVGKYLLPEVKDTMVKYVGLGGDYLDPYKAPGTCRDCAGSGCYDYEEQRKEYGEDCYNCDGTGKEGTEFPYDLESLNDEYYSINDALLVDLFNYLELG